SRRASGATWSTTPASSSSSGRATPRVLFKSPAAAALTRCSKLSVPRSTCRQSDLSSVPSACLPRGARKRGRDVASALTLAVPSKGRLQEQVHRFFADAGAALSQAVGARGYRATLAGFPDIDVMLLSASEIAAALAIGDVHLGVTGEDLLRE